MAAYKQAKRLQRGVKLGYDQTVDSSTATKFTSAALPIGVEDFSIEFWGNTFGSKNTDNSTIRSVGTSVYGKGSIYVYNISLGVNGVTYVLFEGPNSGSPIDDSVYINWNSESKEDKFHLIITRQGTTIKVYINGELKATKEQSAVKDLGELQLAIANSSDVDFVRVWNYALSADDVTAHYNSGDPMGYVVPKAMRDLLPMQISGNNSYTWTGLDDTTVGKEVYTNPPLGLNRKYRINVTVSNYEAGAPYFYMGKASQIPAANGAYDIDVEVTLPVYTFIFMYGGPSATDRRLTLTVNSVTPVGLLAEYLPQNLMASRKGPAVEPVTEIFEFNVGDPYYVPAIYTKSYPFDCIYRVDYVVDEWDFQPKVYSQAGFGPIRGGSIVSGVQTWPTESAAKVGEVQSVFVKMSGTQPSALYLYGGNDNEEATARHLKVTIVGITPVSAPISWLDSAKQMPLSDEYMEPLFQSIGGYDMTANGAPEILYNE